MAHAAFYITGHGFGHSTRMAALAATLAACVELCRRLPGVVEDEAARLHPLLP
jgi:hypothetical protein